MSNIGTIGSKLLRFSGSVEKEGKELSREEAGANLHPSEWKVCTWGFPGTSPRIHRYSSSSSRRLGTGRPSFKAAHHSVCEMLAQELQTPDSFPFTALLPFAL